MDVLGEDKMEMSEKILLLTCMAITVSVISLTVTKAVVFRWLRDLLSGNKFLHELFSCPFCFSYYVTALVLILAPAGTNIFPVLTWFGWCLMYFSIIGMAIVLSGIILYLFSLTEEG